MSSLNFVNSLCKRFSRKNIPEYLYHLTDKQSYMKIVSDGFIKQSHDRVLNKEAVFAVEKNNFLKEWPKVVVNGENLKNMLINQIIDFNEKVVLCIPTKNLKLRKLFVRNQKKLFNLYGGEYSEVPKNPIEFIKSLIDCIHLKYGTLAFNSKFYNKKQPYEYIYKDKINADNIEKVISLEKFLKE